MKNIFFYIYPEGRFASDYILMSEAQIDNSLDYFRPEDIIVVTNFPWEYHGVKSTVVGSELYTKVQSHGTSLSNKPIVIKYLIENKLTGDINWFHDWDIWQLAPLNLSPLDRDIAFVDYSYKPRIQFGSIFFKPSALDVFKSIEDCINKYKVNEEEVTNILVQQNFNNINERFRKLNVTYSIGMKNLEESIKLADKPLRIAHFPSYQPKYLHKANRILPPKLYKLLNDRFVAQENRMKNLLIYISPNKKYSKEHELMAEVQIDNSLDYWKREDIMLVTNFPYEYNGVKATVVPDSLINKSYPKNTRGIINSKIDVIIYLLQNKIINDLTWFHDFDSFQLAPLDLPPINADIGVVCYGIYPQSRLMPLGRSYSNRINFGNIFFKPESIDIFRSLLDRMDLDNLYEEDAMTMMVDENYKGISSRIQIMNQTYNIGMRCVRSNIAIADKPIKIAHFPPHNLNVLHKFSRILPSKLFKILNEKFDIPEAIKDLQTLKFKDERRVWQPFMQKYICQKIAEVGIYRGDNFRRMIEHSPKVAVAVDHWKDDGVISRNDLGYPPERLDQIYLRFKSEMAEKPFVQIYREYTFDAAQHFPDEYFDFIYIDADHTKMGCLRDIEAWYPKVRKGGFITGDDYNDYTAPVTGVVFGVVEAVNEFGKKHNLTIYELPSHGWAAIKNL